jgi:hypothetical protein
MERFLPIKGLLEGLLNFKVVKAFASSLPYAIMTATVDHSAQAALETII